jgi:asparagine synthase (glutamine-hydrolysing)
MSEIKDKLLFEIQKSIKNLDLPKKIGIAFSGGVDSTLIAKICKDQGYEITLLTIGFENSHDILFSKKVNEFLKLPHKIKKIHTENFENISSKVIKKINTDNLSWCENSIAFYYIAELAKSLKIDTVVTANGIDELFCGYNAYREAIKIGEKKVRDMMDSKLDNEIKMMKEINNVCSDFQVRIVQPLLSNNFIEFAKKIPISQKIKNEDDLLRKHIIREIASTIGVPEISVNQRKKAIQYGSLIHKALIKSR